MPVIFSREKRITALARARTALATQFSHLLN